MEAAVGQAAAAVARVSWTTIGSMFAWSFFTGIETPPEGITQAGAMQVGKAARSAAINMWQWNAIMGYYNGSTNQPSNPSMALLVLVLLAMLGMAFLVAWYLLDMVNAASQAGNHLEYQKKCGERDYMDLWKKMKSGMSLSLKKPQRGAHMKSGERSLVEISMDLGRGYSERRRNTMPERRKKKGKEKSPSLEASRESGLVEVNGKNPESMEWEVAEKKYGEKGGEQDGQETSLRLPEKPLKNYEDYLPLEGYGGKSSGQGKEEHTIPKKVADSKKMVRDLVAGWPKVEMREGCRLECGCTRNFFSNSSSALGESCVVEYFAMKNALEISKDNEKGKKAHDLVCKVSRFIPPSRPDPRVPALLITTEEGGVTARIKVWGKAREKPVKVGKEYVLIGVIWDKNDQESQNKECDKLLCLKLPEAKWTQLVERNIELPREGEPVTAAEVFCGHFCTGVKCATQAGATVVAAADKNPEAILFAKKAMKGRVPEDTFEERDLKDKKNWGIVEGAHIVILTPPCEGDSEAGMQMHTDDKRNCLNEALGMVTYVRPPIAILELVPGAKKNQKMITEMEFKLASEDYYVHMRTVCAERHIPQNRARVMVCCTRRDLMERESAKADMPWYRKILDEKEEPAPTVASAHVVRDGEETDFKRKLKVVREVRLMYKGGLKEIGPNDRAGTICKSYGQSHRLYDIAETGFIYDGRWWTPREVARVCAIGDDEEIPEGIDQAWQAIGIWLPVTMLAQVMIPAIMVLSYWSEQKARAVMASVVDSVRRRTRLTFVQSAPLWGHMEQSQHDELEALVSTVRNRWMEARMVNCSLKISIEKVQRKDGELGIRMGQAVSGSELDDLKDEALMEAINQLEKDVREKRIPAGEAVKVESEAQVGSEDLKQRTTATRRVEADIVNTAEAKGQDQDVESAVKPLVPDTTKVNQECIVESLNQQEVGPWSRQLCGLCPRNLTTGQCRFCGRICCNSCLEVASARCWICQEQVEIQAANVQGHSAQVERARLSARKWAGARISANVRKMMQLRDQYPLMTNCLHAAVRLVGRNPCSADPFNLEVMDERGICSLEDFTSKVIMQVRQNREVSIWVDEYGQAWPSTDVETQDGERAIGNQGPQEGVQKVGEAVGGLVNGHWGQAADRDDPRAETQNYKASSELLPDGRKRKDSSDGVTPAAESRSEQGNSRNVRPRLGSGSGLSYYLPQGMESVPHWSAENYMCPCVLHPHPRTSLHFAPVCSVSVHSCIHFLACNIVGSSGHES